MVLRDRFRFSGLRIDRNGLLAQGSKPLGLVVPSDGGFVFHAATTELWSLDRQIFKSTEAAKRAAWDVLDSAEAPEAERDRALGV